MIDVLTTLKNEMETLDIPYTFDTWDQDVELPQFIGEISEVTNLNEDGKYHTTVGKKPRRALFRAYQSKKNAIIREARRRFKEL